MGWTERTAGTAWLVALSALSCGRSGLDVDGTDAAARAVVEAGPADISDGAAALLSYGVVAADYSRAIDRIVLIGTDEALHLVDPHTLDDQAIPLEGGVSVSVTPDGLHAAVGQQTSNIKPRVLYYDLTSRMLAGSFALGDNQLGSVLSGASPFVYAIPEDTTGFGGILQVDVSTGVVTGVGGGSGLTVEFMRPGSVSSDGLHMVLVGDDPQCERLAYVSLSDAGFGRAVVVPNEESSPSRFPCCGGWMTLDDSQIYLTCGDILGTTTLKPTASIPPVITDADFHSNDGTVAVLATIDDGFPTELEVLYVATLGIERSEHLPPIRLGGVDTQTYGLYVFHDAAGTGIFAIIAAPIPMASGASPEAVAIVPL
jgi:hypothetical protein